MRSFFKILLQLHFSSPIGAMSNDPPIYWCGDHSGPSGHDGRFRLSGCLILSGHPSHSGSQVLLLMSSFHINITNILLVLQTVCRTLPICKDIAYSFSRIVRIRNRKYVLFIKMATKLKKKNVQNHELALALDSPKYL